MKPAKRLSSRDKKQLAALIDQASRALSNGRFDICRVACDKIDKLQPGNPDAANFRGILHSQNGDYESAASELRKAVAAAPARSDLRVNLAGIQLHYRHLPEALDTYRKAYDLDARSLPVLLGYGTTLIEMDQAGEAIDILNDARKRYPGDTSILLQLFRAYYDLHRIDEAEKQLAIIIEKEPEHTEAHCLRGQLALEKGDHDSAEASIRTALRITPHDPKANAILAEIKRFSSMDDPDLRAMLAAHDQFTPNSQERMMLSFSLGKSMDKLQQYDAAFDYYHEGNAIRHLRTTYHPEVELAHLQQIIDAYQPATVKSASHLQDETPVFIVGMPRCGSTLTEQILAAHPDVESRGEWGFFERNLMSFSRDDDPLTLERMVEQTAEEWEKIGATFLDRMKEGLPACKRITDKSLNNIRFVGAIHCAMPMAKIVHVRRNPLDTCLSIYKNNLEGHLFDFGCNLEELGHYYRMYLQLMQHWREILPEGAMYELDYEQLVGNQEEESRKLLEYCGLEWDELCLKFNKAKNVVRTASITQVRRPIYTSSLETWKRYEKHLQPLIDILGPEYSTTYKPGQIPRN